MSGSAHSNTSQQWLIFFFVCFGMTVFALGVWACFSFMNHAGNGVAGGDGYQHEGPAAAGH